jgi:lysozyme
MLLNPVEREKLRRALQRDEGTGPVKRGRMLPYRCPTGHLTIGYGRNLDAKGISFEEADHLLDNDISEVEAAVERALPWVKALDSVRQRCFLNLAFNLGVGDAKSGLLSFKNTLSAAERRDWPAVVNGLESSKWYGQVGARADRILEALLTGEDPS